MLNVDQPKFQTMPSEETEIWMKLAQAFIVFGDKRRAYESLNVASKVCERRWEIWKGLLSISLMCDEYETAVTSYNKALDLRKKFVDLEALILLTDGVNKGPRSDSGLRERTLQLFERVLKIDNRDPMIWILYGKTTAYTKDLTSKVKKDTTSRLSKAHKAIKSDNKWFHSREAVIRVLCASRELASAYIESFNLFGPSNDTLDMLRVAQLASDDIIEIIRNHNTDLICAKIKIMYEQGMNTLEDKVKEINNLIKLHEVKNF